MSPLVERVAGGGVSFKMAHLEAKVKYHQMVDMGSQILRSWPNLIMSHDSNQRSVYFKMNLCLSC